MNFDFRRYPIQTSSRLVSDSRIFTSFLLLLLLVVVGKTAVVLFRLSHTRPINKLTVESCRPALTMANNNHSIRLPIISEQMRVSLTDTGMCGHFCWFSPSFECLICMKSLPIISTARPVSYDRLFFIIFASGYHDGSSVEVNILHSRYW